VSGPHLPARDRDLRPT